MELSTKGERSKLQREKIFQKTLKSSEEMNLMLCQLTGEHAECAVRTNYCQPSAGLRMTELGDGRRGAERDSQRNILVLGDFALFLLRFSTELRPEVESRVLKNSQTPQ